MDDIVAVAVELDNGTTRYFMTWGRAFDAVDPSRIEELVLRYASGYALGGAPVKAAVRWSMRDARDETYFYEAVADFAARLAQRPSGPDEWKVWLRERADAMEEGRELYYLGLPRT